MRDWIWDGGRPSLDLLNTLRDRTEGGRETLETADDLAAWVAAGGLVKSPVVASADDLEAVRRLRWAIDAVAYPEGEIPGDAVAAINAAVEAGTRAPTLTLDGHGKPTIESSAPAMATVFGIIAADAVELVTGSERLRVCAAADCGVRFVDRSPAHNRQWCSMRRCGNRTKANRHYRRRRGVPAGW